MSVLDAIEEKDEIPFSYNFTIKDVMLISQFKNMKLSQEFSRYFEDYEDENKERHIHLKKDIPDDRYNIIVLLYIVVKVCVHCSIMDIPKLDQDFLEECWELAYEYKLIHDNFGYLLLKIGYNPGISTKLPEEYGMTRKV